MDDNLRIVELVRQILEIVGVAHVGEAHNGRQGFDAVCRHDYDFVIADWNMPEVDGLEFLKLVRRSELSPNPALPVLMLTANATAQEVREAKAVGIDGYIAKPFTPALLVHRVEAALTAVLTAGKSAHRQARR